MKTRFFTLFTALLALTACGSTAQYASSGPQFEDGIYYKPTTASASPAALDEDVAALVRETKGSQVYLSNGQAADTLFIPENMTATLRFDHAANTTTVTLTENPGLDIWMGYAPYSSWYARYDWYWGSPWYYGYYRPWRYYSWTMDPWYWDSWHYGPWHYG